MGGYRHYVRIENPDAEKTVTVAQTAIDHLAFLIGQQGHRLLDGVTCIESIQGDLLATWNPAEGA